MKVNEIFQPKEPDPNTPAFLRKQAGPVLSKYEKKVIAKKLKHGYVPSLLKKQAE